MKQSTNKAETKPDFDDAIIASMKAVENDEGYKKSAKLQKKIHESTSSVQ